MLRFIKHRYFLLIHSWIGVISSIFILSLVITGIILNNPDNFKHKIQSNDPFEQYSDKIFAFDRIYFVVTRFSLFSSVNLNGFNEIVTPFSPKYIVNIVLYDNFFWIGLSNGLLFKMDPNTMFFERVLLPDVYELYSITSNLDNLIINTNLGLYQFINNDWALLKENNSPWDFWSFILALHAGYLPFTFFKKINTLISFFLIILVITGLWLFFKKNRFYIDKKYRLKENET